MRLRLPVCPFDLGMFFMPKTGQTRPPPQRIRRNSAMTFKFRSVPCVDKLTITFFPGLMEPSLRHFLEEQGITGWSIVSKQDA